MKTLFGAHVLGGHSDGVSVITFNAGGPGDTAVFWSDVVPTTHHVQPPYIMAYDIDVVRWISDEIIVMEDGVVVDRCTPDALDAPSRHPTTRGRLRTVWRPKEVFGDR